MTPCLAAAYAGTVTPPAFNHETAFLEKCAADLDKTPNWRR
jgi:hypothetical protein